MPVLYSVARNRLRSSHNSCVARHHSTHEQSLGAYGGDFGEPRGAAGMQTGSNSPRVGERLTLVVEDTRFIVDADLFHAHPNTMLGR